MKSLLCLCSAAATLLLVSCGSSGSANHAPMRVERWDASSQSWVAATPGTTPAPSPMPPPASSGPAAVPAADRQVASTPEAEPKRGYQGAVARICQVASTPEAEPKRGWMGRMKDAASAPLRWVGIGGAN